MATVALLDASDVPEPVRNIYQLVQKEYGLVPNLLRAVAHCPEIFMRFVPFWAEVYKSPAIGPRLRALAAIGTARAQDCGYCMAHMTRSARRAGITESELNAIECSEDRSEFDERERLIIEYAETLTKATNGVSAAMRNRLKSTFTSEELVNITLAIGLYNLTSRVLSALEIDTEEVLTASAGSAAEDSVQATGS